MRTIIKIVSKRVHDSIIPARILAFRKNGTTIEAGDKYMRPALITLFTLITGKQMLPSEIRQLIRKYQIRVSKKVREIL